MEKSSFKTIIHKKSQVWIQDYKYMTFQPQSNG
jgi:hypothetical protein